MSPDNQNSPPSRSLRIGRPNITQEEFSSGDMLSAFAHDLCHEIDNPLTSIISIATLIQHISKSSTEEHDIHQKLPNYCTAIMDEAWRVSSLIEKLLFILSKSKGYAIECIFNDVMYAALATIRNNEKYQNLDVSVSTPHISPVVVADQEQLRYVVTEILLNAHYAALDTLTNTPNSRKGETLGPINIVVSPHPLETEFLVSTPLHQSCQLELDKLFEPFVTGYRDSKHSGLGLSAVWAILQRCDATIQIEEELSASSCIFHTRITIPNVPCDKVKSIADHKTSIKSKPSTPTEQASFDSISVLIIEDDPSVASAMKKILEYGLSNRGNVTCNCTEPTEAFELLSSGKIYDAILCDLNLPGTSGRHVFTTICDRWPKQKQNFAFLTGDSFSGETRMYLTSCNQPFLYKPFEPNDLINLVIQLANTKTTTANNT